jgi:hypothetical protein
MLQMHDEAMHRLMARACRINRKSRSFIEANAGQYVCTAIKLVVQSASEVADMKVYVLECGMHAYSQAPVSCYQIDFPTSNSSSLDSLHSRVEAPRPAAAPIPN